MLIVYKKAYSLVELSIVIVIISLLLAMILYGRQIAQMAKLNRVHGEYRKLNEAIWLFNERFDCTPGVSCTLRNNYIDLLFKKTLNGKRIVVDISMDHPFTFVTREIYATMIDFISSMENNSMSVDPNVVMKFSNKRIDHDIKRKFFFAALNIYGVIDGMMDRFFKLDVKRSPWSSQSEVDIPMSSFQNAAWTISAVLTRPGYYIPGFHDVSDATTNTSQRKTVDQLSSCSGCYPAYSFPMEVGHGSLGFWKEGHMFVLIRAFSDDIRRRDELYSFYREHYDQNFIMSAMSPNIAQKLDSKFDDGYPYTGLIMGGKNPGMLDKPYACTNIGINVVETGHSQDRMSFLRTSTKTHKLDVVSAHARYVDSSDTTMNGCIVGYYVDLPK